MTANEAKKLSSQYNDTQYIEIMRGIEKICKMGLTTYSPNFILKKTNRERLQKEGYIIRSSEAYPDYDHINW